jgi:excisionase family DNA binding protein
MPDSPPPLLHTVKASAACLAVSESTIWRLLRAGKLRPTRITGRVLISESELQRLIQQNTDQGDPASEQSSNPNSDQSGEPKAVMILHGHKYL